MRPSYHIIFQWYSVEWIVIDAPLEVTPINRQSYMAEISSLLGLITDEHTREVLIAKMEHMFDAAEDEQKLISDIGSPTKVAVALIRYADNGVVTPEAAAVIDSATEDELEQEEEFETLEALDEQPELLIPETEAADEQAPAAEEAAPETSETSEAPAAEVEEAPAEEKPLDVLDVLKPELERLADEPAAEAEAAPEAGGFSEAGDLAAPAVEAETESEAVEVPEADPVAVEVPEVEPEADPVAVEVPEVEPAAEVKSVPEAVSEADADVEALEEASSVDQASATEYPDDEEDEPFTITKVNTFLAILYFIIPGLVIGLPIFLALAVLNLAFLAVAAAVITAAVLLVLTGLTPLALPDRLICFGGAAAAAAIGLVLLWFAIWFLLRVTSGWVRLMSRGGKRFSRKEVEIV